MQSQNLSRVSIDKVPTILSVLWKSNKVAMIWGPPGVGKSVMVRSIAETEQYTTGQYHDLCKKFPEFNEICGKTFTGRRVFDNRLLLMNPTDIKGLPVFNSQKEEAEWLATNNFPMDPNRLNDLIDRVLNTDDDETHRRLLPRIKQGIHDQHAVVFLDELSLAPKLVQGAALQLVLDRSVGEYTLPDNVDMVAAGNRVEDKVGATAMSPALVSRMTHIHIDEPSFKSWKIWALENDICLEVLGYLSFSPENLFEFDATSMSARSGSSSYPCPRTWEFASDVYQDAVKTLDNSDPSHRTIMESVLSGTIGEGITAQFLAWVDVYIHLPSPKKVLNGEIKDINFEDIVRKQGDAVKDDRVKKKALSLKFAFITSLIAALKQDFTKETAQNVARFVNKKGIEDAEWAMILVKKTTEYYTNTTDTNIINTYMSVLQEKGGEWENMLEKLGSVMAASDMRKAG